VLEMHADRGRAVVGEGVVPVRLVGQPLHRFEVVHQDLARLLGRHAHPVKVGVLAAVVRAQPHHVALVRDHVVELVLAEEAEHRGIGLALLLARLDRDRERRRVLELPAHDGVRDQGGAPERQEQVDAGQPVEVVRSRLPDLVGVGLGAVGEVADVLDRDAAVVEARRGGPCHVGLPVAVVAGRDAEPPERDGRDAGSDEEHGAPRGPHPHVEGSAREREGRGERPGEGARGRAVEPERGRRPGDAEEQGRCEEQLRQRADFF